MLSDLARREEGVTDNPSVEVGVYLRQDQAEERALVILAMQFPYWIVPRDGLFSLRVRAGDAAEIAAELQKFEAERQMELERTRGEWEERQTHPSPPSAPKFSLFAFVWIMALFFGLQAHFSSGPGAWTDRGVADSSAIVRGEWWRTLTALTLHADLPHLIANVGVGLIFAAALLPLLGTGWTWAGIVLSGAAGNWLNAWGHRGTGDSHFSIGASTAVFGGLGMLVGWQVAEAIRGNRKPCLAAQVSRTVWFPIGAGLALLAYLGSGSEDERVDFMAHLFGMLAGGAIGFVLAWTRLPQRTPPIVQNLLATAAVLLPWTAWAIACWK
jgi:membrane associated rhomboid family serine protease